MNAVFSYTNDFAYIYTCTAGKKTPIYYNTNYRTGMKLVPIIMEYCLLQFNALKFWSLH